MTPEKECERLRAENDLLRATLTAASDALVDMRGKLDSLDAAGAAVGRQAMDVLALTAGKMEEIYAILDASPRPFEAARGAKSRRSDSRAKRAIALHNRGLSYPRIGLLIARDEGRVYPAGEDVAGQTRPYSVQQVGRWVRALKG
jgi:hypothetical protein